MVYNNIINYIIKLGDYFKSMFLLIKLIFNEFDKF